MSTISPNQRKAALMNSSTAKKAMRLAAMLATSPTEAAAPLLAASRMFCSSLHGKKTLMGSRGPASPVQGQLSLRGCPHPTGSPNLRPPAMSTKLPLWLPHTSRTRAALLYRPSPRTHPLERRMLPLPLNLDSSTSG